MRGKAPQANWPGWLVFLGDASYSIYLVHVVIVFAIAAPIMHLLRPLGVDVALVLGVFVSCGVAVAAGTVFHLVVERPLLRWSRRLISRQVDSSVTLPLAAQPTAPASRLPTRSTDQ